MKCPNCSNEYFCPCKHCQERQPDKTPWIRLNDSGGTFDEMCPNCGLTKDVNEWMDIEYEQYKEGIK